MASLDVIRPSPSSSFSESAARTSSGRQRATRTADDDDGPHRLLSGGPVADIRRAAESSDEMSSALAQFRLRANRKEENRGMAQSYDYILEEDAPNKIREILGASWVSAEELTRLLREAFDDISDRWVALQALATQHKTLRAEQQLALEVVIAEAQAAPPEEIRARKAGVHCAIKARLVGHQMALDFAPNLLRAAYRSFLTTEAPDIELYQTWISGFGFERREQVLIFMEGAIVDDMRAEDPSSTPPQFASSLERLGTLRRLRTCEHSFVLHVSRSALAAPFNASERDWLHFLLVVLTDAMGLDESLRYTMGVNALLRENGDHARLINLLLLACQQLPGEPLQTQDNRDTLLGGLRDLGGAAYARESSARAVDPTSRHRRSV
ncbi:SepL/TyeA/HrpJ family type III secretion system gatekeeper [Pandoraea capi]|uniref:SepL/TyeA/HrpJ family type III secretion system gatekeeper n=1 Tax=Pandoraea capi TaxID=2508286 RepID=A0ABY6VWS3_9BURK|nr:type III secretion system gatekeeper subunit SctW [Pandoraea capi]VVD90624.1 SepL/TyeA/HrpJ family type III secretion system gatekeeper [Pandoraea capi]